ncbi:Histidine kinase [Plasmodiophora brassicae]|uniref:histidine kinase n=1 Tax=Plasmodiophora brassicae TaxID=37360 RepID=A0A0G4IZX8_PLABS|nr:hypothetical protein PBRA_008125 [Plasmodiophora brassicae]
MSSGPDRPRVGSADQTAPPVDYRLIFETLPALCIVLNTELRIVAATDAYLEATMTRRDDIAGRGIFDVFPENPDDPTTSGSLHNLRSSLQYVVKHRAPHVLAAHQYDVRKPGGEFETRYWSPLSCPVLDPTTGDLVYIIHRVEDVTELLLARDRGTNLEKERQRRFGAEETVRRMEWEVLQRAEQVQQQARELSEMNAQLAVARDKAIQASNVKSAFVAMVSHELRTPLTGIIGFTDLLMATPLSDDQTDLVNLIGDSARVLLSLVNDILDISKLEAGNVVLEQVPFHVADVVRNSQRLFEGQAQMKSLQLSVTIDDDVPELVRGDPYRLRQILLNLISNAIKFTDTGGVTVNVGRNDEQGRDETIVRVRFEIVDTGIGIIESHLARLCEPFSQFDSSDTRRYGGTGLGLNIVRTLVDLMGGQIGVQSVIGQGSVFWVVLPFGVVDSTSDATVTDDVLDPRWCSELGSVINTEKVILVVDDNAVIRRLVSRQLSNLGYEHVLIACDGQEALLQFDASGPVDLILMDCQMPDLDGCGATRAMRNIESRSGNPPVPIIAMTASAMHRDREMCLQAGMNDMLTKPFTVADLAAMLQKWL